MAPELISNRIPTSESTKWYNDKHHAKNIKNENSRNLNQRANSLTSVLIHSISTQSYILFLICYRRISNYNDWFWFWFRCVVCVCVCFWMTKWRNKREWMRFGTMFAWMCVCVNVYSSVKCVYVVVFVNVYRELNVCSFDLCFKL